ncbi:MAG: lipoate--protein ligase [Syntrophomonadaceae bacterium]|nr:lipoate--protein ligase [Syntrophomonadaceae bacterium]
MKEIINRSNDPYFNLALEEYAVMNLPDLKSCFILWQNRPAVIVGRNQNTIDEINQAYVTRQGITVVRRMSGGGAVYHDPGNLNFTFVLEDNHGFGDFVRFTRPVIKALQRLGIEAENNGRNDITIAGRKFSGNAQFKYRNRLMHHGTILFATDIEAMVEALNPGAEKISSKGIKSVRSRVTNISEHLSAPVGIEEFKQILREEVFRSEDNEGAYQLTGPERQAAEALRDGKYAAWHWNYGASPPYNIRRTRIFPWGSLDLRLEVKRGAITGCRIYGDYFSGRDMAELEAALIGLNHREEEIRARLEDIDLSSFLPQAEKQELIELFCR